MTQQPETPSLLDAARNLHSEHAEKMTARQIAKEMGYSHQWVRSFVSGDIPNPGVLTVEKFIAAVRKLANV